MEKTEIKQKQGHKMGDMPINKLLISMSLPIMISMIVQALYNVVDSIFVAQINENALTAVSLCFPIQNFMISIIAGTAVGANALLSKSLGEKNYKRANMTASTMVVLAFLSYLLILFVGIFLTGPFFRSQTTDPQILEYGSTYSRIVCCLSIGAFMQMSLERLLQSTGRSFYSMITQTIGAVINIIMDPILIFGYFGLPALGVAGAAYATVFGQIVASALALYFNVKKNPDIDFVVKDFKMDREIIGMIYKVGIPSIVMMSIGSVMNYGLNKILLSFTATAAAVFGVYFKLQSFVFMPVFGLNSGMVPIIAYNYGSKNKKRMMDTLKLSLIYVMVIMLAGMVAFRLFTRELLMLFNASESMMEIGVPALHTISLCFIFAGVCIVTGAMFQALGNGVYTLIVSVARQLIVLLPVAWLLAQTGEVTNVWWCFPIAEIASFATTMVLLARIYKKTISVL